MLTDLHTPQIVWLDRVVKNPNPSLNTINKRGTALTYAMTSTIAKFDCSGKIDLKYNFDWLPTSPFQPGRKGTLVLYRNGYAFPPTDVLPCGVQHVDVDAAQRTATISLSRLAVVGYSLKR